MIDLNKLEELAKAAEQMFAGMHWYTRFQILDGISNDESAAFIGALDPDTVLELIALARAGSAAPAAAVQPSESVTLKAFKGADTKEWHITIQHPFGTSWVKMSDPRDIKLAELLATATPEQSDTTMEKANG